MKRIYVNVPDKMAADLKEKAVLTGCPIAEQIRRAISAALSSDQPGVRKMSQLPVLFSPRQETR